MIWLSDISCNYSGIGVTDKVVDDVAVVLVAALTSAAMR